MKIVFDRDTLVNGLQDVQSVVSTRSTLPILSNLLIQAEGDSVLLRATDLDVTVQTRIGATIEREGGITLPAKRLLSLVKELPNQQVELDVDDKYTASVSCGSSFYKLVGIAEEEYPKLPEFSGEVSHSIDQGVFRDMLRKTIYAASKEEARVALNSCLLNFQDGKLAVVATDGRRLALMEHEMEFPQSEEIEIVLPFKTADELIKLLDDEGALNIKASQNQAAFEFGNLLVLTKLTDQAYPNFRQVIPQSPDERVALEREALLNAVRRVSLLTSEQSNDVRMTFGKNRLELVTVTPDVGEAREKLPVKYDRKEITISFNSSYLIDPLKALDGDEVYIEFTDEFSPGLLKADIPFLYVIMPLRINKT